MSLPSEASIESAPKRAMINSPEDVPVIVSLLLLPAITSEKKLRLIADPEVVTPMFAMS